MTAKHHTLLCAAAMIMATSPHAGADSKMLPGHICDPGGNSFAYVKESGHVQNTAAVSVFYWCPIVRENTNSAPILTLRLKVDRPAAAADFNCTAFSHRANGTTIASKTRSTAQAGLNTLVFKNLSTVVNGMVNVVCGLPPQARIVSIFWDE